MLDASLFFLKEDEMITSPEEKEKQDAIEDFKKYRILAKNLAHGLEMAEKRHSRAVAELTRAHQALIKLGIEVAEIDGKGGA
jgi:hypothetical protein